jgi:hypothetical protein
MVLTLVVQEANHRGRSWLAATAGTAFGYVAAFDDILTGPDEPQDRYE